MAQKSRRCCDLRVNEHTAYPLHQLFANAAIAASRGAA
jgi:hypothetical protein